MNVLFTTPFLEHPPASGPGLRIENSIKALAKTSNLYVISQVREMLIGGSSAKAFYQSLPAELHFAPSVRLLSNRFLKRNFQKLYRRFNRATGDARFMIEFCDARKIDVIWCGFGNISWPLIHAIKTARPDIRVVCDTDSVWSRFILRELDVEGNPRKRRKIEQKGQAKEIEERSLTNLCDAILAVSEVDGHYYRSIASEPRRVHIFSNVIDLASYVSVPPPADNMKNPSVYLAGTFGHASSPMDRAARWVVEEVLPIVRAAIPDTHFYIVGKNSNRTLRDVRGPGITVTGRVESVLPYLRFVDAVLVPLKFESGTRFKILEAGAVGQAVVSTTLGAEGIEVADGRDILLADDAEAFASAIIRILRDRSLARCLGNELRELVTRKYSLETLEQQARDILNHLADSPARAISSNSGLEPGASYRLR